VTAYCPTTFSAVAAILHQKGFGWGVTAIGVATFTSE
jgi:hypothetical protein